jgi:hypothetical protein
VGVLQTDLLVPTGDFIELMPVSIQRRKAVTRGVDGAGRRRSRRAPESLLEQAGNLGTSEPAPRHGVATRAGGGRAITGRVFSTA